MNDRLPGTNQYERVFRSRHENVGVARSRPRGIRPTSDSPIPTSIPGPPHTELSGRLSANQAASPSSLGTRLSFAHDSRQLRQSTLKSFFRQGAGAAGRNIAICRYGPCGLRKNHFGTAELRWPACLGQEEHTTQDAQKGQTSHPPNPGAPRRALLQQGRSKRRGDDVNTALRVNRSPSE